MTAEFTVDGKPKGKARPRVVTNRAGKIMTYTPKDTAEYEELVQWSYAEQCPDIFLHGSIQAEIKAYFAIPKGASNRQREQMLNGNQPYIKKPDCDNLAKAVLDALNGLAFDDDSQITSLKVEKTYGETARIEVKLSES